MGSSQCAPKVPNRVWRGDITYIATVEGSSSPNVTINRKRSTNPILPRLATL